MTNVFITNIITIIHIPKWGPPSKNVAASLQQERYALDFLYSSLPEITNGFQGTNPEA